VGLLKTAGTVAVASSVHGRMQRGQQTRWAAQEPSLTGVPAPSPRAQYVTSTQPQQTYPRPQRRRHQSPKHGGAARVIGSHS